VVHPVNTDKEMAAEDWWNNQINFFSKEMFLLMSYKNYMAENNVVGAGIRSLGGSPTSTPSQWLIIRYS
jgi:hypothetical protein